MDAITFALDRQVDGNFGFSGPIIADNNHNSFNIDLQLLKSARRPDSFS
jgi:hypothetical protein